MLTQIRLFLLASAIIFVTIYYNLLLVRKIFTADTITWYGSYHYFVESLSKGVFPLWDPYTIAGTPFYQNIPLLGNLEPTVLLSVIAVRLGISPLTAYIYMHLARLLLFSLGAYYLFKFISGCRISATVAACVLFFSSLPVNLRQPTVVMSLLSPFALYFLLRFFNENEFSKKYLYFFLFTLTTGITFSIHIPSYFLLNIISFFVIAVFLKIIDIKKTVLKLRYRLIPLLIVFIALITAMSAPSLAIYSDSRGRDSELFPSLRIIQKNDGVYKKLMASAVGDDALSQKFTKNLGVYSSSGNLLNLIYPDLWKYHFGTHGFQLNQQFISETVQYIGIVPFIIALIGFIYSKGRWRVLSLMMLGIITINMISWEGVHNRPPNAIQLLFNIVFPFLKMIEVREVFSGFFLLWLCALLALGLRIFFDSKSFKAFVAIRFRTLLSILAVFIAGKALFTYMYWGNFFYISNVDLASFAVIGMFASLIYLYHQDKLSYVCFCTIVLIIILADIGYYNLSIRDDVIRPDLLTHGIDAYSKKEDKFSYIRIPFVENGGRDPFAFAESILEVKGAMSSGDNHHLFTTKRYYDYFTHVPLEKQFILSGMDTPIIRFFSDSNILKFNDKIDALNYMSNANEEELRTHLFIEEAIDRSIQKITNKDIEAFKGLEQYPNLPELTKEKIIEADNKYMINNGTRFMDIIKNPEKYMTTADYSIEVIHFSQNRLTLGVHNNIDGYLYYNDGWSKYWRAYDNGKEVPIKIANYNFKAVLLNKGNHELVFDYDPWLYKLGLLAYAVGLMLTVFLAVFYYIKTRGKNMLAA